MSSFIPEFSGKRGKRTRGPRNQRRRWTRGRRAESGTKTGTSIAEAYLWSLADPRFVHDTTYFEARARRAFYSGTACKAFTAKSLAPVLPARRSSTHSTPAFERRMASLVVDSGPPESALPKKMRSMGWEAMRRFFVYWPGTAMNIGWPR